MSAAAWHFRRKRPSDTARDPISSEFFADESVEDAARALVRESIQNSLDARLKNRDDPVVIRVFLGVNGGAALPSTAAPFFDGVWPHLSCKRSGLQSPPSPRDRCSFLTIEDFSTTGLEGDPDEWTPKVGKPNAFYSFFRAEAYSEKQGDDRGRWGVGKLVFPRSSRGSAFFGFTVPVTTGQPLLMGRMILRHHEVGAHEYVPDAMFGVKKLLHNDPDFVAPCTDARVHRDFRQTFSVTRTTQPGLSVVVPWLDDEDSFTLDALTKAIASEYMLPVLRGRLVVTIEDGSKRHKIDRDTLLKSSQKWIDESIADLLKLGIFASRLDARDVVQVSSPDQTNAPKWAEKALADDMIASSRARLEGGDPVAFEVPITVYPKQGAAGRSRLRVHMIEAGKEASSTSPVFVREDITVTGARGTRVPGYVSLVTIDDGPLATLLGDAENPAHTEWRHHTRGFREKYKYPKAFLTFVREAPHNVFSTIFKDSLEEDHFALGAFFPDVRADSDARAKGGDKKKRQKPGVDTDGPPKLEKKPRRHGLRQVDGGFEVTAGDPGAQRPSLIRIRAAYDVRRGDPLKRYEPYDFDFSSGTMNLDFEGLRIRIANENEVLAEVTSDVFRLRVTGFDSNRDVFVRVTLPEGRDER